MPRNRVARYVPRRAGVYGGAVTAAAAAGRALGNWYSNKRRRSNAQSSESNDRNVEPKSGMPSTFQNDRIVMWRKKRVTRKGRSARRFYKRVMKVSNSLLGNNMLTRVGNGSTASAVNGIGNLCFYIGGANDPVYPDLQTLMVDVGAGGSTITQNYKVAVGSQYGKLMLANKTGSGQVAYVSFYYFVCRRDMPVSEGSILNKYVLSFASNTTIPGGAPINAIDKTALPFMAGEWCQHFLITKIVRVTLADGQETILDMRNTRKFMQRNELVEDMSAIQGVTRGVLVCFHGGLSSTGTLDSATLSWQFTRSYSAQRNLSNLNTVGTD